MGPDGEGLRDLERSLDRGRSAGQSLVFCSEATKAQSRGGWRARTSGNRHPPHLVRPANGAGADMSTAPLTRSSRPYGEYALQSRSVLRLPCARPLRGKVVEQATQERREYVLLRRREEEKPDSEIRVDESDPARPGQPSRASSPDHVSEVFTAPGPGASSIRVSDVRAANATVTVPPSVPPCPFIGATPIATATAT